MPYQYYQCIALIFGSYGKGEHRIQGITVFAFQTVQAIQMLPTCSRRAGLCSRELCNFATD